MIFMVRPLHVAEKKGGFSPRRQHRNISPLDQLLKLEA
jgi:hypothetical protein